MPQNVRPQVHLFWLYYFIIVPLLAVVAASPAGLGRVRRPGRHRPARRLLLDQRGRHHRRLPPPLHPRRLQGQAVGARDAGRRRQPRDRGPARPLGRRPPQAPRLQRQGGRPALTVAVRRVASPRCSRGSTTPTWGGSSTSSRPRARKYAPDLLDDRAMRRVSDGFGWIVLASVLAAGPARRPAHLVVVGRRHRLLLGRPRPHRPGAPHHLVDQLDLPRHGRRTRSSRATVPATSGGWRSPRSVRAGTTCTTPTRPAPGTASRRGRSTSAPD